MRTHSLANGFGIQIKDVDLAAALDDETFNAIRTLWMEHRVAIFPNQNLDDDRLVAFTERFGPLFVHCLLYTSPSPRDRTRSRMPSSA